MTNPLEGYSRQLPFLWRVGWSADPSIDILLNKERMAQIKVHQLEMHIQDLQSQIQLAQLEVRMLKEEYKIK